MKFRRGIPEDDEFISMASTADIMFLLLIFFLVTTTFNQERGITMQLPDSVVQEDIPAENVSVSIDTSDRVRVDGKEIPLEELGGVVKARLGGRPDRFVLIKSDQGVRYGRVVDVLDQLFQNGIHNIALPTRKESIGEVPAGNE